MPTVRLTDIAFDAGTQIRAAIDQQVVADYAEAMTSGAVFPPIVLFHDGNKHYLADGFHRFMAAQRIEWREIDADVRAGTQQDALWFALGANKTNGKRLTTADKKHAILLAIQAWPDKSPALIAEQVGCTDQYARDIRHQSGLELPSETVGRDGRKRSTTRGLPDAKRADVVRRLQAGDLAIDIQREMKVSPNTVSAIRQDIGLREMPDRSREAVAQRRQDIRDMAGRGFTTRQIAAALRITESSVSAIAKKEQVVIHADRVLGKTRRHDSTRIVETMVMDAEHLTADVDLIDFRSLPKESIARWLDSLNASHKSFSSFIKRLKKELSSVEAA